MLDIVCTFIFICKCEEIPSTSRNGACFLKSYIRSIHKKRVECHGCVFLFIIQVGVCHVYYVKYLCEL